MKMNMQAVAKQVQAKHDNAVKHGVTHYQGIAYDLYFENGGYSVCENGYDEIVKFNTRSIMTAKKWLREWMDN